MPKQTLVLTGGGTAGHVWPNFALLEDVQAPLGKAVANGEVKVCYLGSRVGMERELVEKYAPNWTYYGIHTGKLRRYFSWQNFIDPFRIILGVVQAFLYLYRENAAVVFSKGGFVSAPVVWAAWVLRIPVVIHESDVTPALATKLTLPFATKAIVAFEETRSLCSPKYKDKILPLGIPIRPSLFLGDRVRGQKHFNLDANRKTILIFGGSLGADGMNKKLVPALPELSLKYNVIHICGKGKKFALPDAGPHYHQFEFLKEDMADAYAVSDIAICRAGASSIFELAALRIPMFLIPLGLEASRGDQIVNSKIFQTRGWAEWSEQSALSQEKIIETVDRFFLQIDEKKAKLASAPGSSATFEIGSLLLEIIQNRVRTLQ